ncbi:MAG: hypothetical protein O7D91_18880 [Planctomycetota bacterium]|nr:hypothetical protein [Planctomycetota bacterium]
MTAIKRNLVTLGVFVGIVGTPLAKTWAETCKGNDPVSPTKQVCATWDEVGDPELFTDFTVDYDCTGCSDAPRVELKAGGSSTAVAWVLYSEVISSGAAANLGDIALNPTVASDKFELSIKNGAGAGAVDVASIILDDAGFTGYSNLGATTITGNVNGAITLVEYDDGVNPPVGGEVTGILFIGTPVAPRGVVGPITIPKVSTSVYITGDYGPEDESASHNIDIGVIANTSSFTISGNFLSDSSSAVTVDIGSIGDATTSGGFAVSGSLANSKAIVTIADMVAGNVVFGGDFGGTLDLKQGVPGTPQNSKVEIGTLLTPVGGDGGKVELNGKNVDSNFNLGAAQSGTQILNGGQVNGVFYPCEFGGEFAGEATFTGVAAGGQIWAFDTVDHLADVSGDITINGDYAGLFKVDGDFTSTASLTITGDLKANSGNDGLIWIVEEAAGDVTIKQDLIGHVHHPKTFATNGSLTVEGNVTSSGLFKTGDNATGETHDGDLIFQGNVVGDILIHGNMSGDVTITKDQTGDLTIDEDLSGSVTVGGALANGPGGGGRILVLGESSGPIKVGEKTGSLTVIRVRDGLATGARIEINTTRGHFSAVGDIYIGGAFVISLRRSPSTAASAYTIALRSLRMEAI